MVFRIRGNYQARGAVMMAANAQSAGLGSFMTDFNIDGGVARVASSAFMNPLVSRVRSRRVLVGSLTDEAERKVILQRIGSALSGTAPSTSPLLASGAPGSSSFIG